MFLIIREKIYETSMRCILFSNLNLDLITFFQKKKERKKKKERDHFFLAYYSFLSFSNWIKITTMYLFYLFFGVMRETCNYCRRCAPNKPHILYMRDSHPWKITWCDELTKRVRIVKAKLKHLRKFL